MNKIFIRIFKTAFRSRAGTDDLICILYYDVFSICFIASRHCYIFRRNIRGLLNSSCLSVYQKLSSYCNLYFVLLLIDDEYRPNYNKIIAPAVVKKSYYTVNWHVHSVDFAIVFYAQTLSQPFKPPTGLEKEMRWPTKL